MRELATIFDVRERGEQFIAELQDRFDKASSTVNASGTSLVYWFADTATPYMAGCCGSPGIITNSVGAENIYADTTDEWPQVSWESVADRNPEAFVLADLSRRSLAGDALVSLARLMGPPDCQRVRTTVARYRGSSLGVSASTVPGRVR